MKIQTYQGVSCTMRMIAAAVTALGLLAAVCAGAGAAADTGAAAGINTQPHTPRLVPGAADGAQALRERIAHNADKARQYEALKARVQPYVERHRSDPAWIVSRLQMYWQSKATQVFVKNDLYDHAEGTAPVPTVRFTGARDTATPYMTPRLEDVKPYMGENDRLYLQNKAAPGQPWEWAEQAKTGRIIETINLRIVELARDAAFIYWYSGDEAYAKFAYDIFDTYMTGLYYRLPAIDLNRGHAATIVALQSFEVIHEDTALPLTEVADFMHGYLAARAGAKSAVYDGAFKQWADVIISNGVPWNNWNLIKARWALQIAAVLGDDRSYADGRGRQYYVKAAVEGQGLRQWSLQRLLAYGYDDKSAMWNESPGYAMNVLADYLTILEMLDRLFGIDLMPQMGVLPRAALAAPQYLLPNGRAVGFGDTRYDLLRSGPFEELLAYAERKGLNEQARQYAALLAAVRATGGAARTGEGKGKGDRLYALLAPDAAPKAAVSAPVSAPVPAAIEQFQTPTYYAPGPSWLVQRNGYTLADAREQALVISQAGSNGNHAHANGIAMELYAQGLSLAPESGRGSGYFQQDYRDYYAQFPAHNTVVVDGKSNYAPMQSNHPLTLLALYPQSGQPAAAAFPLATFSDVAFHEPETGAYQQRVLGTVRLDDKSAYFVDIFRSRRGDGKDRYHDYIYHNLGQSLQFQTPGGAALAAAPTGKLAFADQDLTGYDYWWDRKSLTSVQPLKARFELKLPQTTVAMTAWLQGSPKREYFSLQSPPSTAWVPGLLPAGIDTLPLPTLVIRQTGEAWSHPFTAVFEALKDQAPASVLNVEEIIPQAGALGLCVTTVGGRRQTILSNDAAGGRYASAGLGLTGRYGIVAERAGGAAAGLDFLFLGSGREISGKGYAIRAAAADASAALWQAGGHWYYSASQAATLRVPAAGWAGVLTLQTGGKASSITGRVIKVDGRAVREFAMPAMAAAQIR